MPKKDRKTNTREELKSKIIIYTEGKETEKNYFNGLKNLINNNKNKDRISVKIKSGCGQSMDIVDYAKNSPLTSNIADTTIWLVFDRDDRNDFDKAIKAAHELGYKCTWSNRCFEIWFVMHFQCPPDGDIRDHYNKILTKHLETSYEKNDKNVFDKIHSSENIKKAINRSKYLQDKFKKEIENKSYSLAEPCCNVHELVEDFLDRM